MNYQFMDDPAKRVTIFEDTMDLCWNNPKLSDAIDDTIEATRLYMPKVYPLKAIQDGTAKAIISVTQERTLAAAKRLHESYPDSRIVVLNFASAISPGGGVKTGGASQESSLCRCSTLYQSIDTDELFQKFYQMHRNRKDLRYTDTCIYSPGIVVMKSDTAFPELLPEKEWFFVDVLTCAAPVIRKLPNSRMNPSSIKVSQISDAELLEIHKKRGKHILNIAAANKADILVLGAFGCGASQNSPRVVAQAYIEILPEYASCFKEVVFAIYSSINDCRNFRAFLSTFGS